MSIREQRYTPYEGETRSRWRTIIPITVNELSIMWSFIKTKLLLILTLVIDVIYLALIFIELGLKNNIPIAPVGEISLTAATVYIWIKLYSLILLYTAIGCDIISHDIRHELMQFYFSKPLKRAEYLIGKFLSLFALGFVVTVIPTIGLVTLRALIMMNTSMLVPIIQQGLAVVGFEVLTLICFSAVLLALSSLTDRRGYAILSWLAIIFIPDLTSIILGQITRKEWPYLVSFTSNLTDMFNIFITGEHTISPWIPPLIVVSITAGAIALVYKRIQFFEQL